MLSRNAVTMPASLDTRRSQGVAVHPNPFLSTLICAGVALFLWVNAAMEPEPGAFPPVVAITIVLGLMALGSVLHARFRRRAA